MAPIYVKGGVWTNVEDAILKAAISKYGLNQWARVSSLLEKKTAKQCKMRWQEWLDPRIKKLEWTKEEDQKLLELVRLRPNQWNSISMLMNRTANQCIERYQQLLDDNLDDSDLRLTGNMQQAALGADSLNLNPESKPARPDFEDMDDDEREMLSEARARLANTQGKKAKRKARERMLAESRRVAIVQKRRELKQAGINSKFRTKKKFATQMDYNNDVAFAREPEEGRFDTSEEKLQNLRARHEFDDKAERNQAPNLEHDKLDKKRRRQAEEARTTFQGAAQSYDDDLEFKKRKLELSAPEEDQQVVDIDAKIKDATKDLNRATHEKSILFTKADEEQEEESDPLEPKESLSSKLAKLPAPLNDFEIVDSDSEQEEPAPQPEPKIETVPVRDVPNAETANKISDLKLPAPDRKSLLELAKQSSGVDRLVLEEMVRLVEGEVSGVETPEIVEAAIEAELSALDYNKYVAAVENSSASDNAEQLLKNIRQVSEQSGQLEKKFAALTNGYLRNQAALCKDIANKYGVLSDLDRECVVYEQVKGLEERAIEYRSSSLQESIDRMTVAIGDAQQRLRNRA
ncbi:hypothetical protein KL905_003172 [Ogataea polymorpha]|nr:hypothetical protein KL937_003192 [Ogataea polymorpha]KAG7892493.1 hypothetical protein KL908_003445 [Ogataea polymorpha]KAG7920538.1 hypothetical protein KL905_003172 [Ogataea polymorpha]KAG7935039.1 hypothetical protein KL904_003371 [Ogataea polymorpha]